jgi:hypothetical protein
MGKLQKMDVTRALHGSPMGDPFKNGKPMGTHGYPLGILQISVLKPNAQRQEVYRRKLVYFCIDSNKQLSNIENPSRVIGSFLINPQLKCFEISLIFHGLLLLLQKKIEMKIFLN